MQGIISILQSACRHVSRFWRRNFFYHSSLVVMNIWLCEAVFGKLIGVEVREWFVSHWTVVHALWITPALFFSLGSPAWCAQQLVVYIELIWANNKLLVDYDIWHWVIRLNLKSGESGPFPFCYLWSKMECQKPCDCEYCGIFSINISW